MIFYATHSLLIALQNLARISLIVNSLPGTRTVARGPWRLLLCWLCWSVLLTLGGVGASEVRSPLEVGADFRNQSLSLHLEYLADPEKRLTLEEVLGSANARFQQNDDPFFNAGLTDAVYWFRFQVNNLDVQPRTFVFYVENEFRDFQLYRVRPDQTAEQLVNKRFIAALQANQTRRQILGTTLELAPGENLYYLRWNTAFEMKAPFSLWHPEVRDQEDLREHLFHGLTWGGVASFGVFFLIIYGALRESVYVYYALFLFSFLSFRILERIWAEFFFFDSTWVYWIAIYSIYATLFSGVRFSQKLLGMSESFPRFNRVVNWGLGIVLALITVTGDLFLSFTLITVAVLIVVPLSWVFGILSWRKGNPVSKYYLMGLGLLLIPAGSLPLMTLGWLEYNPRIRPIIEILSLVDCIVFSVALAVRFRTTLQLQTQAQETIIAGLQETDRLRDQFLANVSHELRTPLHGMIGLAESVAQEMRNGIIDKAGTYLELIVQNGQRLNTLIENLLDLSGDTERKVETHIEPASLLLLLKRVIPLMENQMSGTSRIISEIDSDLPPVLMDSARIEQVLINLISNAQKHAPGSDVLIRVERNEQQVRVEVQDQGPGIPQADRERIFQPFEQGANIGEHLSGLGLGLSICREILEAHQGEIGVQDRPQGGSIFYFTLSQATAEPDVVLSRETRSLVSSPASVLVTENKSAGPDSKEVGSVLVVDDEMTNIYILMNYLGDANLIVHGCNSGKEALSVWQEMPFDLVILDVRMPEMDGYEVCEVIREKASKEELPILFLSAMHRSEDIALGLQAGANDYLFKPILRAELQARVLSYVELTQLRRQQEGGAQRQHQFSKQELLAQSMKECLKVWEQSLGKEILDLAQESQLWGAYLDKTNEVWRTPGLRQYLSATTIPNKPRWRKVAQTLEFVMSQLPKSHDARPHLLELHSQILKMFSQPSL